MRYLTILIFLAFSTIIQADATQDSLLSVGENLFRSSCKACHNIDKKLVGPALSKVYERRDSAWINNFIKGSQKMIADGDPIAVELFAEYNQVLMPNQPFDNSQINLIINYIKNEDLINSTASSSNPISRPTMEAIPYYDHFRFSNFVFWIPFTVSIILGVVFLYYMTIYHDIVEADMKDN